jgi:hypothetical protein
MKITPEMVGEKVRNVAWEKSEWTKVLCIGKKHFLGENHDKWEGSYNCDNDWEFFDEPRKPSEIIKPSEKIKKLMDPIFENDAIKSWEKFENMASYLSARIDAIMKFLDELHEQGKI